MRLWVLPRKGPPGPAQRGVPALRPPWIKWSGPERLATGRRSEPRLLCFAQQPAHINASFTQQHPLRRVNARGAPAAPGVIPCTHYEHYPPTHPGRRLRPNPAVPRRNLPSKTLRRVREHTFERFGSPLRRRRRSPEVSPWSTRRRSKACASSWNVASGAPTSRAWRSGSSTTPSTPRRTTPTSERRRSAHGRRPAPGVPGEMMPAHFVVRKIHAPSAYQSSVPLVAMAYVALPAVPSTMLGASNARLFLVRPWLEL